MVYKEPQNKIEKTKEVKKQGLIDVEKNVSNFNLQTDLSKVKNYIPFNELLRNREYRDNITNMVKSQGGISTRHLRGD